MPISNPAFNYDQRGQTYSGYRQTEPAIAAYINHALADARTVLNIGAGAGSYEPTDRYVIAVEPSAEMRRQRLTNNKLRSTTHRVVNPPPERRGKSRYSMPYFLHFRSDFMIEALRGTVPAGEQAKWAPITANDYLQERLREIKLV